MKIEPLSEELFERLIGDGYTCLVPKYKYTKNEFGVPFKLRILQPVRSLVIARCGISMLSCGISMLSMKIKDYLKRKGIKYCIMMV